MSRRLKIMICLCFALMGYMVYSNHTETPRKRIIKVAVAGDDNLDLRNSQAKKLVNKIKPLPTDPSVEILGYPLDLTGVEEFVSAEEVGSFIEDLIGEDGNRNQVVRCQTKNNHCLLDPEIDKNSDTSYCITRKRDCLDAQTNHLFLEAAHRIMLTSQTSKEQAKIELREFILNNAPKEKKNMENPRYEEERCEVVEQNECNYNLEIEPTPIGSYICWTEHPCIEDL